MYKSTILKREETNFSRNIIKNVDGYSITLTCDAAAQAVEKSLTVSVVQFVSVCNPMSNATVLERLADLTTSKKTSRVTIRTAAKNKNHRIHIIPKNVQYCINTTLNFLNGDVRVVQL